MSYIVYHTANPHAGKRYFKTAAAAKRSTTCSNRNAGYAAYDFMEETFFYIKFPIGTKVVKNLMTGEEVEIASNTPRGCDPSSELYWSM